MKNRAERSALLEEARMQTMALKRIQRWLHIAILISTAGAGLIFYGLQGTAAWTVLGIAVLALGLLAAILINYGLRNGRRNVEHILEAAGEGAAPAADGEAQ